MENINNCVEETKQNKENNLVEKCVICGAETPYRFNTPISAREYYVEGAGQLCQQCHYKIYIKKTGGGNE